MITGRIPAKPPTPIAPIPKPTWTPPFTQADAERVYLGKLIRTSYESGPYIVVAVDAACDCPDYLDEIDGPDSNPEIGYPAPDPPASEAHVHLVCHKPDHRKKGTKENEYYLGGYRLDGTSVWSNDRIIFLDSVQPQLL